MRFALSLLLLASSLAAKNVAQSPKLHAADSQRLHELSADIANLETLELFVNDLGNESHDWAAWVNPTFHTKDGKKIPVTKKHIADAKQAWRDLQVNKSVGGGALTIDGKTYDHALGTPQAPPPSQKPSPHPTNHATGQSSLICSVGP